MARLVKKNTEVPQSLRLGQKVYDDSHKKTADEEDNKIYAYERERNNRIEVKNWDLGQ